MRVFGSADWSDRVSLPLQSIGYRRWFLFNLQSADWLLHTKQLLTLQVNCCSRKQTSPRRRKQQPETGFVCIPEWLLLIELIDCLVKQTWCLLITFYVVVGASSERNHCRCPEFPVFYVRYLLKHIAEELSYLSIAAT